MPGDMTGLRTAHTADLDAGVRSAIRGLMDAAFGTVSDDTFDNVLGGVHALIIEDGELIGYVEGVAVRADRRRQGHGAALMAALERVIRSAYQLGALGASDEGGLLYAARGWQLWRGPSSALTPDGIRHTADKDGIIYVLPVSVPLDVAAELTCDWRPGSLW